MVGGKVAAMLLREVAKKSINMIPPIITVCQFFQVMFISNSGENTLLVVRLHKAYMIHTRKL